MRTLLLFLLLFSGCEGRKEDRYVQVYANELGDTVYSVMQCWHRGPDAMYDVHKVELSFKTRHEAEVYINKKYWEDVDKRKREMRPVE